MQEHQEYHWPCYSEQLRTNICDIVLYSIYLLISIERKECEVPDRFVQFTIRLQLHVVRQAPESDDEQLLLSCSHACALAQRFFPFIHFVDNFDLSLYSNIVANGSNFANRSQNNHDSGLSGSKGVNFFIVFFGQLFFESFVPRWLKTPERQLNHFVQQSDVNEIQWKRIQSNKYFRNSFILILFFRGEKEFCVNK